MLLVSPFLTALVLIAPAWAGTEVLPPTWDLGPWDLVRVDVPDYPGALATSERGSVLIAPPTDGTSWRVESVPEPDDFMATEGIEALGIEPWQAAGWDGEGIRIAVFDLQYFGADLETDELGEWESHDCFAHSRCTPPIDTLRPSFSYESGVHGIACAEVIRDIAPGAELHLVRVNGLTSLENAAQWAVREDVDIVSMSLSFYNESFYDGTGAVNAAVEPMFNGGTQLVSSAGNSAREHWLETFHDPDRDGVHEFPGGSEYLPVWLDGGAFGHVYVTWDEFSNCGNTDLDAYIYREDGPVVGRSEGVQDPTSSSCWPVERVSAWAEESNWYYLRIIQRRGPSNARFSLLGSDVADAMAGGSVADPGSNPTTFTVGAVRASNYLFNDPESFSSQGPTHGGAAKPDIAGPDGLSTSSYGPTGFYGTSASTPAVAATLALVMQRYPDLSPREAAGQLQHWAIDDTPLYEQPDMGLGAGYARLPPIDVERGGCGGRPFFLFGLVPPLFARRCGKGNR